MAWKSPYTELSMHAICNYGVTKQPWCYQATIIWFAQYRTEVSAWQSPYPCPWKNNHPLSVSNTFHDSECCHCTKSWRNSGKGGEGGLLDSKKWSTTFITKSQGQWSPSHFGGCHIPATPPLGSYGGDVGTALSASIYYHKHLPHWP